MRKILLATVLLLAATTASAHGYWRHDGRGGWNWVAPAIVGGAVGYAIARPPVYVQPAPPVIIEQQPVVVQGQNCSPWTQIQNPDGSITSTRTCR